MILVETHDAATPAPFKEILRRFEPEFKRIEEALQQHFSSHIPFVNEVSAHILFAGGKRLRPLLTVCAAKLCGKDGDEPYKLSAVPEYLHAASLLHDDVVDAGQMRRGRLPAYKIWGNSPAVLVGDFLYARAIHLASSFGDVRIAKAISETVALMSEGEIIQLLHAKNPKFDEETYFKVINRKTAALISTSCKIGALLGRGSEQKVDALAQYGLFLGQAFQMIDDVLDYTADTQELGKAVGTDLAEGKITLPIVKALKEAGPEDRKRLISMLGQGLPSREKLEWVRNLLKDTGGIAYTRQRAENLIASACQYLDIFPKFQTREFMKGLARYVLERKK